MAWRLEGSSQVFRELKVDICLRINLRFIFLAAHSRFYPRDGLDYSAASKLYWACRFLRLATQKFVIKRYPVPPQFHLSGDIWVCDLFLFFLYHGFSGIGFSRLGGWSWLAQKMGLHRVFDFLDFFEQYFISHILLDVGWEIINTPKRQNRSIMEPGLPGSICICLFFVPLIVTDHHLRGRSFYFSDITCVWVEKNLG